MMRNPKIMKKAQSEVRAVVKGKTITEADIQRMHYMKLVVKETMRLHCVPILLPRVNPKDCVVDGYDIPAKTTFLPFGAGRRMCPGLNFGLATVEYAIANLLHRYDWKLPDGVKPHDMDMREITRISTLPIQPLQIVPISMAKPN
ncbi:putative cytochrome P450 [Helianthus debilis subsp. tardiflorus]